MDELRVLLEEIKNFLQKNQHLPNANELLSRLEVEV